MAPATKKELPQKEKSLFKELLTLYETRQLKKGVKTADQILKKFPENGETLCMKGLLLTHMGKRDEGLELVKKGIRFDLTSHICWHVFGLIQKGERNYEEALKSYTQALRFDKENLNLLADAANLQTQLRHFDALQDTRETILKLRPTSRRNWVGLAVAHHLNGNLAGARAILDNYERTLKDIPDYDLEHSEVTLYRIRVLEELGEYNEALSLLDFSAKERIIIDRTALMEARARLTSKLDKPAEAEQAWRLLIEKNPECYDYYQGLFKSKGFSLEFISSGNHEAMIHILQELADQHPRAVFPRRLALTVAIGDDFKVRARNYLLNGITKGIPSLFGDIKSLYSDTAKQQAFGEIAEELKTMYSSNPPHNTSNGDALPEPEPPTTYLWILYFLAQHHSQLRHFQQALSVLNEAIEHTPTLPELYACKARVLKRAGDLLGAVRCIEEARKLDGQDRFLNTKSAKYHLRAGLSEEAQAILGLFTKKDAISPAVDLEDMQSILYLTEEADAQRRSGKLGHALKKYLAIQNIFDAIYHDQYDFHTYSIRKFILNIYVDFIQWEGRLKSNPDYVRSAIEAARIYVRVYDDPKIATTASVSTTLTEAEKKAQKKAKKAAAKSQDESKKATATGSDDKGLELPTAKDDDPDGSKALCAPDTLEQAWKLVKPLTTQTMERVDVCISVYNVSVRRQKYLQASKALLTARSLNVEDPDLHVHVVDFKQRVTSLAQPLPSPINSAVSSAISLLLPDELTLETFNSQYLQRHSISARAILAAAQVSFKLKASQDEVESTTFGILAPETDVDIKSALEALMFLSEIHSPRADEFRAACDKRFELSTVFKTPEEQSRLRTEGRALANGDASSEEKVEEIS